MPRRIEIELTSARPDGSWTWRAAGAREPKGVLDGSLLHGGAKPGDVLKAEADFELEGITIVSVFAPKEEAPRGPERIEVLGPSRGEFVPVTTQLSGRPDRRPGDRRRERDREDGRPRRDRDSGRPQTGRDSTRPKRDGDLATPKRDADQSERGTEPRTPRREKGPRTDRRPEQAGDGERKPRSHDRQRRPRPDDGSSAPGRPHGAAARAPEPDRRRAKRLNPGNAHRQAVLESLPPEEQAIAEQVLRGGIPAVRTALHLEREKAQAEGRPAPNTEQLIAMAEGLLPRLKTAEWHDRAEAAAADTDNISLRDLRSVVSSADVARDDETRALAANLREALERRVSALHEQWSSEISKHLDENRLVRAIRVSARPPDPAARLDSELSQRLADAAGAAMSPDAPSDRWIALIEAVAESPVRRVVQPVGLPADPSPDLKRIAHQNSGTIPALGKLLGVAIPPPPTPSSARRRPDGRRPQRRGEPRSRSAGDGATQRHGPDEASSSDAEPPPQAAPEPPPDATHEPAPERASEPSLEAPPVAQGDAPETPATSIEQSAEQSAEPLPTDSPEPPAADAGPAPGNPEVS